MSISRRTFVGAAAAVGLGVAAAPALADEAVSARWVDSADLVVVGGGGASVLVLEKAGFCGGNTQLSNGMLMAAGTKEQLELAGCDTDTPEAFAEQQVAYAQGHGDAEMIRDMCLHSPEAVEFMTGLGRVYADCSIIPPVWTYDTDTSWGPRSHWDHHGVETAPDGHFGTLRRVVAGMDAIRVKTETEARTSSSRTAKSWA